MITSTSNSRVKEARSLHRKRRRQASGQCLLEGARLIADAWRSGVRPDPIFYVPDQVDNDPDLTTLLGQLQAAGAVCLACTPSVLAALTNTVTPQGVAAVVSVPDLPVPVNPTLVLVLDGVRDPGNAGTLLRTAEAAGVELVLFGPGTVDPLNGKVLRGAMGAHFRVPLRTCGSWSQLVEMPAPLPTLYVAEASAPRAYDQIDWTQPAALLVGGETAGPSPEARRRGRAVAIPMAGRGESLNAAVAGAVILFEAARQRRMRAESGH